MAGSKRGPAPDPVELRLLKGETRPSRVEVGVQIPPSDAEPPKPPKRLERVAAQTWRRLAPELWPLRLLSEIDLEMFEIYCVAVAIERRARAQIPPDVVEAVFAAKDDTGKITTTRNPSGAFRAWRDAVVTMRGLAAEFGLTPSARATIRVDGPKRNAAGRAKEILS